MFNVGLPELLLVVLITFVVAPREIPKVMRKVGQLAAALRRMGDEIVGLEQDVKDIIGEGLPDPQKPAQKPAQKPVQKPARKPAAKAPGDQPRAGAR